MDICRRLRTDFAVMARLYTQKVPTPRSQVHFVLPETLCEFRGRIDEALMDELIAIQAAAAMEESGQPRAVVIDTFPFEQGSQRVTDATTLYKAQKKPWRSSRASRRRAAAEPRSSHVKPRSSSRS